MSKNLFFGNILASLGELGDDIATHNWGGVAETVVDDVAQVLFLKYGDSDEIDGRLRMALNHDATHILGLAMLSLHGANLLAGFAQEEEGERFITAKVWLEAAGLALESGLPDQEWRGTAADSYTSRVDELRKLVNELAELDQSMKALIEKQAGQVDELRNVFGYLITSLTLAMGVSIALYLKPISGPVMSHLFQIGISTTALSTAVTFMGITLARQADNASVAETLGESYRQVGAKVAAVTAPTPRPAAVPVPDVFGSQGGSATGRSRATGVPEELAATAPRAEETRRTEV